MDSNETVELEKMKRPQLVEVAARYNVQVIHNMSNVALITAIKAAAGYTPPQPGEQPDEQDEQPDEQPKQGAGEQQQSGEQEPAIEYVMMRRTTDGDGPHPIHPDEVDNYISGDWVIVEQP